jgi:thiol:disulfide interchange protein DsbC
MSLAARSALMSLLIAGSAHAADTATQDKIRAAIAGVAPQATITKIQKSEVPGMVEVSLGAQVLYVTSDAKYVFQGSVFELPGGRNLTEARQAEGRKAALAAIPESQRIIFKAAGPKKHSLVVFTDIDCGYCRKLHSEMADYNKLGIEIEYLFFPRAGIGSPAYDEAVSVWCAKDRHQTLTAAKAGTPPAPAKCDNPIEAQYKLGLELGVSGTPNMIAEDGTLMPGYIPPADLIKRMDELTAAASGNKQAAR